MYTNNAVTKFLTVNRELLKALPLNKRLTLISSVLQDTPYVSGRETIEGFDCSGSVCYALLLCTGKAVRLNSDGLLHSVFIKDYKKDCVSAAFFIKKSCGKETAVHTALLLDCNTVLNASEPCARIISLKSTIEYFAMQNIRCVIKSLDLNALNNLSQNQKTQGSFDDDFIMTYSLIKGGFYE